MRPGRRAARHSSHCRWTSDSGAGWNGSAPDRSIRRRVAPTVATGSSAGSAAGGTLCKRVSPRRQMLARMRAQIGKRGAQALAVLAGENRLRHDAMTAKQILRQIKLPARGVERQVGQYAGDRIGDAGVTAERLRFRRQATEDRSGNREHGAAGASRRIRRSPASSPSARRRDRRCGHRSAPAAGRRKARSAKASRVEPPPPDAPPLRCRVSRPAPRATIAGGSRPASARAPNRARARSRH